MAQESVLTGTLEPKESLVSITNIIYLLHATSIVIGIVGAASIIGAFLFGIPSIIAVIINYIKRSETRGTYLESHFRWQIRTFWFAMLWVVIGFVLLFTVILIPVSIGIWVGVSLWVIYRVARGWLRLKDKEAMYV